MMFKWLTLTKRRSDALSDGIASVRDSVVAVLRIHPVQATVDPVSPAAPRQFQVAMVGTAWCIVENRYFVTAHHIFNDEQPRDHADRFYIFTVPQNGPVAYHTPVMAFPLEDHQSDFAILEIPQPTGPAPPIPASPVTFRRPRDGEHVLTYGFPAPVIARGNLDQNGNWGGGEFFLKGHANEGIVSGQFEIDGHVLYELNVGWYNGESGGPILSLDPVACFAVMQRYRRVQTRDGVVPGPRQGRALTAIESHLRNLGACVL